MGIAYPIPEFYQYEIGNYPLANSFSIDTVGITPAFNTLTIPSWLKNKVEHAFLDAYFPYVINSSAVENELAWGTYIQVGTDGSIGWTNAILTAQNSLNIPASTSFMGLIRFSGGVDIKTMVNNMSGSYMTLRWDDIGADADFLICRGVYFILRVYMRG